MDRSWKHSAAVFIALVVAVQLVYAQGGTSPIGSFNRITREEIELLLKDVAMSNPMAVKRLAEDPEMRTQQIESLRQLLAFASQARKDGIADDPTNRQELENIRSEVTAVNYDREINKNKGSMPPFGFISDARVRSFWTAINTAKAREEDFEKFLRTKVQMLSASDPKMRGREISQEEREQARDFYAKVQIYEAEYEARRNTFPKEFRDKIDLQVKLQQAQFLARLYSEKVAERVKVTDAQIDKYIAKTPELDISQKKIKAEKILARAKAGEDFAALANEFSDDPGNKDASGKPQGGLYQDVKTGVMVPAFERAALALRPGEVSPGLVETDFGYHIVKLEKKGPSPADPKSEIYDVRHILVSTEVPNPTIPTVSGKPIRTYVREKLEDEAQKLVLDELIRTNDIQVAEDFTLPDMTAKKATVKKRPVPKKKPVRKRR